MLAHQIDSGDALRMVADLCIELGYPRYLYDSYLLYFAQDDLRVSEIQWYWPDATRDNIEEIIREYATKWIQKND
jgi:hypothetical protein